MAVAGHELNGTGIDRQEGAHRVRRDALLRVQFIQLTHCAQAERCCCVADAQHIGGHVHDDRSHGRMIRRHIGKQTNQNRSDESGDVLNQSGLFGEPHHAQPEGHGSAERQRDIHHSGLGRIKRALVDGRKLSRDPGH